jgi:hypothetical protein
MNDPYDNDPSRRPPGGEGGPRKPRIEVLRTEPGRAAAAAPVMAPPAAARPAPARPVAAQPVAARPAAAAIPARRSGGLLRSPAALLALLGLAVLIAAIWYTASQDDSGPAPFDVGDVKSGPAQAAPAADADEAEPDLMFAEDQPAAAVPADADADAPPAPAPAAESDSAPARPAVRAAPPETAPEAPVRDAAPAEAGSALATARAFYGALSAGDGRSAAQLVVPEKRGSGPLSAAALTRYYSSFRRPLRVRSMTPVGGDTVRVSYDYVLADGRVCRGAASVNVVRSGGGSLVRSIRTAGPC